MNINMISFIFMLGIIFSFTLAFPDLPKRTEIVHTKEEECTVNDNNDDCNVHFSNNLDNEKNCSIGTQAWPLMYRFNIEYKCADGNNGNPCPFDNSIIRYVYTINGITPGPTIHANKGDWIIISVTNNIKKPKNIQTPCSEIITEGEPELCGIHWHGITMRGVERMTPYNEKETPGFPFMDGVPGINQCPIPGYNQSDKNRFDYFFQFLDSGTYWYHSHFRVQLADGLVGSIIVKDCDDVKRFKYIETDDWDDNIVNVQDWYDQPADIVLDKYMNANLVSKASKTTTATTPKTTTTTYLKETRKAIPAEPTPKNNFVGKIGKTGKTKTDCDYNPKCGPLNYRVYNFDPDKIYRLRLISTTIMLMGYFSIDDHQLEIIEVDGMLVKPNEGKRLVDNIPINSSQRYSVLIHRNKSAKVRDDYWMHFNSPKCSFRPGGRTTIPEALAIVHYGKECAKKPDPSKTSPSGDCTDLKVFALKPRCDDEKIDLLCKKLKAKADFNLTMNVMMDSKKNKGQDDTFYGFIATYYRGMAPYDEHNYSVAKNNTFLEVLKGIHNWDSNRNAYNLMKSNSVLDILFINTDNMQHPIHLHGHFFYLLGWEENAIYDESSSSLNLVNPIQRDTATIPGLGWLKIRFTIDNPGVWPMHCHIDWHIAVGMLAQFVELPENAAKIFNTDGNKAPYEWCEFCNDDATKYCAAKIKKIEKI